MLLLLGAKDLFHTMVEHVVLHGADDISDMWKRTSISLITVRELWQKYQEKGYVVTQKAAVLPAAEWSDAKLDEFSDRRVNEELESAMGRVPTLTDASNEYEFMLWLMRVAKAVVQVDDSRKLIPIYERVWREMARVIKAGVPDRWQSFVEPLAFERSPQILIDTMLKATTKVRDKALQQMRNKLNSIINGPFWTAANLARDMVRVDRLGLRQSMRQWIMDDLDLLTIKARMIDMPRLTEVRKNAINTFDADYATMCHRLNEPDEQVPSSNQPQLRGQVNALGWEREDEHHDHFFQREQLQRLQQLPRWERLETEVPLGQRGERTQLQAQQQSLLAPKGRQRRQEWQSEQLSEQTSSTGATLHVAYLPGQTNTLETRMSGVGEETMLQSVLSHGRPTTPQPSVPNGSERTSQRCSNRSSESTTPIRQHQQREQATSKQISTQLLRRQPNASAADGRELSTYAEPTARSKPRTTSAACIFEPTTLSSGRCLEIVGREVRHGKQMHEGHFYRNMFITLYLEVCTPTPPSQAQQSLYIPKIPLYCDLCNNECVFLNEQAFSKHCWTAHGVRVTLKDWRRHYALKDNKAELKRWLRGIYWLINNSQPCLTLQQSTKPERDW